jgi:hypothetical protein
MALSPADFAAYSRATGTPYPEDPEERAELVPEVAEFRRNQLRQPQESSNLLETLGIAALGLGTLVGAGLAGRRLLGGGRAKTVSAAPGAQVGKIPTGAVEKIRQEGRPAPVVPSKVAAIPQATVDLTSIKTAVDPLVQAQASKTVDTGLRQKEGKIGQQLQRNEDLDLASTSAGRWMQNQRELIKNEFLEEGFIPTPGLIENELANRLGVEASTYGSSYTRRKNAMQLGATYGGELFTNVRADTVEVAGMSIPVSEFKQKYITEEVALGRLPRQENISEFVRDIRLAKEAKAEAGAMQLDYLRNQITLRQEDLGMLQYSAQQEKDPVQRRAREMQIEGVQEELEDLTDAFNSVRYNYLVKPERSLAGAQQWAQKTIDKEWPTSLRPNIEEGSRIFFEQDPTTLEPIPASIEIRSGYRPSVLNLETPSYVGQSVYQPDVGTGLAPVLQAASGTAIRGKGGRGFVEEPKFELSTGGQQREYVRNDPKGGVGIYGMEAEGRPAGAIKPGTAGDVIRSGVAKGTVLPNTAAARRRPTDVLTEGGGYIESPEDVLTFGTGYGGTQKGQRIATRGTQVPTVNQLTVSALADLDDNALNEIILMGQAAGDTTSLAAAQEAENVLRYRGETEALERQQQSLSSVRMSESVRRANQFAQSRNPMGGVIPDEITTLRRQLGFIEPPAVEFLPEGKKKVRGLGYERQGILSGVTGYSARQRQSPADLAAQQLESYMSKLQRGRSTPLTSEVVIQPRLF